MKVLCVLTLLVCAALAQTPARTTSTLWAPKPDKVPQYIPPHKPLTKLVDVKAAHAGKGSDYTVYVGVVMLAIALVFVWRSFYAMRIPKEI